MSHDGAACRNGSSDDWSSSRVSDFCSSDGSDNSANSRY